MIWLKLILALPDSESHVDYLGYDYDQQTLTMFAISPVIQGCSSQ